MPAAPAPTTPLRLIGLMSGTSMDGVDAAYVETDGAAHVVLGADASVPFDPAFRARLAAFVARAPDRAPGPETAAIEAALTDLHAQAVHRLLAAMGRGPGDVDAVGFHGQTVWHRPHLRDTWQMGDARRLADALGITVVSDFRTADVRAGGQGAPLVPIFHAALARRVAKPAAILNVGGVANLTWIGAGPPEAGGLLAFDTGPGNGLIDDWMARRAGLAMDEDGAAAARGRVREGVVARMLADGYLDRPPPKSLDRFAFSLAPVADLALEDGAATLTAFTAACVARGLAHCPARPARLLVAGGGRRNPALMAQLARYAPDVEVAGVEAEGWRGDAVEAQAFAYLAARCIRGLPISFPGTTGVARPLPGGVVTRPSRGPLAGRGPAVA